MKKKGEKNESYSSRSQVVSFWTDREGEIIEEDIENATPRVF